MTAFDLLKWVIQHEFQSTFKDKSVHNKAMLVKLSLHSDHSPGTPDDFYPKVELLLWAPANYVRVFVRESDPHRGAGPWVKVHDHDSCWPDGVERVLKMYVRTAYSFDSHQNWYQVVEPPKDLPTPWGHIKQAKHLPHIWRNEHGEVNV